MDDLISRQAAIDACRESYEPILDFTSNGYTIAGSFEDILNALPSAEPQERKGKWIDGHRRHYSGTYWFIYCSECMYERDDDNHDKDTPYCPNCGCKMEVEHDSV